MWDETEKKDREGREEEEEGGYMVDMDFNFSRR
jgi:hypothetical protein